MVIPADEAVALGAEVDVAPVGDDRRVDHLELSPADRGLADLDARLREVEVRRVPDVGELVEARERRHLPARDLSHERAVPAARRQHHAGGERRLALHHPALRAVLRPALEHDARHAVAAPDEVDHARVEADGDADLEAGVEEARERGPAVREAAVVVDEDVREVVGVEDLLEVRPAGRGQGGQVPVARLDAEALARAPGDALDLVEDARALAFVDEPPPARPDEAEMHGAAELERLGGPGVDAAAEGGDLQDLEVRVRDANDPAGVHGDALAGDRVVLEDQDAHAAPREEERDREAIDPGAHDDDVPRAGRDLRVAPLEHLAFSSYRTHRSAILTPVPPGRVVPGSDFELPRCSAAGRPDPGRAGECRALGRQVGDPATPPAGAR